jgi:hypothetical protein
MWRTVIAAFAFGALSCSQSLAGDCVNYGPSVVKVTGSIFTKEYFGPPNYGENPSTDSRERFYFIALDRPLCVAGDRKGDQKAENTVKTMEMVYYPGTFQKIWLGKHVSVTGTLFHAITAHHHSPVLITANETRLLPRRPSN